MPVSGTTEKMKFSITDFFSKCDQIRSLLKKLFWKRNTSEEILLKGLPKKSLMKNLILVQCGVTVCAGYFVIGGPSSILAWVG